MIVLASQSTGRLATLRAAGIEPHVRVSDVDEDLVLSQLAQQGGAEGRMPTPAQQVQALATAKARAVAGSLTPADCEALTGTGAGAGAATPLLVVGCDSMLEIDGQVVGKPANPAQARERWRGMRGGRGKLHTGHCVIRASDGRTVQGVSTARITFGAPSDEEIDAYVASGEPLWCAGAFAIDGLGGAFIDSIEGDPHGVVGVSLPLLRRLCSELGVRWTDLWNRGQVDEATAPRDGLSHVSQAQQ